MLFCIHHVPLLLSLLPFMGVVTVANPKFHLLCLLMLVTLHFPSTHNELDLICHLPYTPHSVCTPRLLQQPRKLYCLLADKEIGKAIHLPVPNCDFTLQRIHKITPTIFLSLWCDQWKELLKTDYNEKRTFMKSLDSVHVWATLRNFSLD